MSVAEGDASSATSPPLLSPTSQPLPRNTPKSPPLAFERTSNDALAPLISPPPIDFTIEPQLSPSAADMGFYGTPPDGTEALQNVVDKQAKAINQVHLAYAAEREAWLAERESLHQRIANLERLLRANNGHSPAKSPSPSISPANGGSISSPPSRHQSAAHRLSVIAEDENAQPLSQRRGGAAHSIDLPSIPTITGGERLRHNSVVAFTREGAVRVEEIPGSPGNKSHLLSPLAPEHRALAGHTPLKAPVRPLTPPPRDQLEEGIEDTPTRNNTHINAYLTQSKDDEEDRELKGPLALPELPNQPGEDNFTSKMLYRKLERIAQTPDHEYSRPMIFAQPSPGMMTPEEKSSSGQNTRSLGSVTEKPLAPAPTRDANQSTSSSNAFASQVISPQSGIPLSLHSSHDEERDNAEVHRKYDNVGVKLKKKPSSNFGAPFGSLGGFGSIRRPS